MNFPMQVNDYPKGRLPAEFFQNTRWEEAVLGDQDYTNTREVTCRYLLQPGEYVVMPSVFDPDIAAAYLLRLFAWTTDFECW